MDKKILVVGGGPLQVPLIKKINEMGYISLCVDKNPNADGFQYAKYYKNIDIIDKEKCLKYAIENKIDGVLTIATDFPIETVSYIAQEMELVGISCETAKLIKNKYLVKKKFFENNICESVQFFEISSVTQIEKIEKEIRYPIIVKPCDGSGSKAIEKLDNGNNLRKAIIDAINSSISKKAFIETYIEGQEYGVESFVKDGEVHVLGIMKKYMTNPPYYAELGHSIPSGLSKDIEDSIVQNVTKAIKTLGVLNGSVNMDLILSRDNKANIIDVGARMGGNVIGSHIIPSATGIDILENLVKLSIGESVNLEKKLNRNISTRLLDFGPGKITKILDMSGLIDGNNVIDIVLNKKVVDITNTYKSNVDTFGWIVVSGNTPKEAENLADSLKLKIKDYFKIEEGN